MAKEWFGRKSLTVNSELVLLKTRTMNDGKLNGYRILTELDLGAAGPDPVVVLCQITASGNSGPSITTMTVRDVSTPTNQFPVTFSRSGKEGMITIPAFSVTARTGIIYTLVITGAFPFIPKNNVYMTGLMKEDDLISQPFSLFFTKTGALTLTTNNTEDTLAPPFGLTDDITLRFVIN